MGTGIESTVQSSRRLTMVDRVLATDEPLQLIQHLRAKHGPMILHSPTSRKGKALRAALRAH